MIDFTFLTEEQVTGWKKLNIFKKIGLKCKITDFSILLGGSVYSENETNIGKWWTKTPRPDPRWSELISIVNMDGEHAATFSSSSNVGSRPALSYSSIKSICSNAVRWNNDILEVEYGEYPQTIVPEYFSNKLEIEYLNETLNKTGKKYTTNSIEGINREQFKPTTHIEYEYLGKKYIRLLGDIDYAGKALSDGRTIKRGKIYWVSVEPIKWIIDERTDIAISKNIVFSGIQFDINDIAFNMNKDHFNCTSIKNFMNSYFSKEIIPSFLRKIDSEQKNQEETNLFEAKKLYEFNSKQLTEEDMIMGAIKSDIPVFLHGQSSEGKITRVKQIDPDCVIIYLPNATLESLNGKSVYNSETGEMIDVKPTWLKKLEDRCEKEPDKYHIVFLDEITNALPSIQRIAFNIVLDREANGIWQLPKNARIVVSGNEMKDSLAANQLDESLLNNFAHFNIKTIAQSWLQWATERNIHPVIIGFVNMKNKIVDDAQSNTKFRKWEMASKMLYATGQPKMLTALVGEDVTREFCRFCNQRVITLEDVINENYTEKDLRMSIYKMYATAIELSQVDEANFKKVREFIVKLGEEPCAIFDSLWAYGDEARMEIVQEAILSNSKGGRSI